MSDTEKPMSIIEQLRKRRTAMTVHEVAELLAVSIHTVYRMAEESQLPYLRVRGLLRFDPVDILEWTQKQKPVQPVRKAR